ncbi:hypothetical protein GCM10022254_72530 [Actinomadura meridiana]|uniref:Nucleotide exchange factor GrpE n=1 Tax=Actinomadura meridiana TaxID=559626 RepID=A0ABP8CPV7_9ACTN
MSRDGEPTVDEDSATGPESTSDAPCDVTPDDVESGDVESGDVGTGRVETGEVGTSKVEPGEVESDEVGPGAIRDALAGLAARLDREHERAAHREAVIDRLHEENQRLRRGELRAMLEPVKTALYRLHDQTRRESGRLASPDLAEPPDARRTALLLAAVADDVADALARLGVERFTVEPGAPYDAARHRPVAVTPVDDPLRDNTVTAVQADGFEQDGRVLRKAAVSVGRLDETQRAEAVNNGVNTGLGTDG